MRKTTLLTLLIFACAFNSYANGITVQKVALSDTNRTAKTVNIRFNISWENSWRDSVNWDAAWIFVKFREPKDSIWKYRHLHLAGSGNTGTGNAAMKFAFPDDKKGVFFYRNDISSGHIKMDSVKLLWNYGADNVTLIDSVEIKVFATEMVYVPAGSFALGDGNGTLKSSNAFQLKNAQNNYVVITDKWSPLVNTKNNATLSGNDDAVLYTDGIRISGLDGLDTNNDKVADLPDFPTGYRSFYCMKYDVTQGQFADFLNTLSLRDTTVNNWSLPDTTRLKKVNTKYKLALQSLDPIYGYTPPDPQRHTVVLDSVEVKYTVSRPDRAFGKAGQQHLLSFSDWSGLRPMSEMEYEKAARGPLPPIYKSYPGNVFPGSGDTSMAWSGFDWAWGNDTTIARANNQYNSSSYSILNFNGIENGTETFSNYNIYKRYINPVFGGGTGPAISKTVSGGDGGDGPYRVGIFATDSSNRISSGATYYGIMDFSKNVSKLVINAGGSVGRSFSYKKHGDGILNAYGLADTNEFLPNNTGGPAMSGGATFGKQYAVSERHNYGSFIGFRSVRTAPSDN
jgi:formylglycine-generating enzyme required for sulfatase activity